MIVVGIDPGYQAGAAVITDCDGVVACWRWKLRRRKAGPIYTVTTQDGTERELSTLSQIGEEIKQTINGAEYLLVVEDLFGRGRTLQRLAESAGEVMGPLRADAFGVPIRPGASTWRPQVLGISPRTKADAAEQAAITWAQRVRGLDRLASCGHVCEAVAIAAWGRARLRTIDTVREQ